MITASALAAARVGAGRFHQPVSPNPAGWVAVAALVGFAGSASGSYSEPGDGRDRSSARSLASPAPGSDGLTSLAVRFTRRGGWRLSLRSICGRCYHNRDPLIVRVTAASGANYSSWTRKSASAIQRCRASTKPVLGRVLTITRVRWLRHQEVETGASRISPWTRPATEGRSHRIAEEVRHALFTRPRLAVVNVYVDPSQLQRRSARTRDSSSPAVGSGSILSRRFHPEKMGALSACKATCLRSMSEA